LPENYEITTESISDILQVLNPKYSAKDIEVVSYDLRHSEYQVGYVGLDNISKNDYSNVVLQLLSHIEPIRDFYINLTQKPKLTDVLTRRALLNTKLGLLVRKMWSKYLFRSHVSPHEFLQYVSLITKNTFPITEQRSPKKFLVWLLNYLNHELVKATKIGVFSQTLQGNLEVTKTTIATEQVQSRVKFVEQKDTKVTENHKFWIIQLDLPPHSVFDETKIQEVEMDVLLNKYNGHQTTMISNSQCATYNLIAPLPPYILIHIDRKLEDGQTRGNPTVVKFPSKVDFGKYTKDATTELNYELIANIRHELMTGLEIDHKDDKQTWSIDLKKDDISWVTLNNSESKSCERELLFLNENYIQVWKRCE
jgi:U4/U6.U5 tri-snRNP-associated protein 2